ncbi:MAG: hypothetical protein ACLRQ0_02335 [Monoglobales bacterium]
MEHETNNHQREKLKQDDTEFTKTTTYDFDKNSFVVEPVFKEQAKDTLGTVLVRLMQSEQ